MLAFEYEALTVRLYAPREVDPQQPHGTNRKSPAGVVDRFEDFTDDLAVWVLFFA